MVVNDVVKTQELNKKSEEVQKREEPVEIIQQCEDIIRTKKKRTIHIAYYQGKVFKKFKDKERFIKLITWFKLHKTIIIFKINIFTIYEKYPKLTKSSTGLVTKIVRKPAVKIQRIYLNYLLSS